MSTMSEEYQACGEVEEEDDDSVEYEYKDAEDSSMEVNENPEPDREDQEVQQRKSNSGDHAESDDWSVVSEEDKEAAKAPDALKEGNPPAPTKGIQKLSIQPDEAMSTASSWSMLSTQTGHAYGKVGDGREGTSRAGYSGAANSTTDESTFTKIAHPKLSSMSYTTIQTSVAAQARTMNLSPVQPPAALVLPAKDLPMISCPGCTMANLPGAQTCVACEIPLTANPQLETDHQIALQLAKIEEENTEMDLQSLLLDGTVQPQPDTQGPTHKAHHCADIIRKELKIMTDTLASQSVCNVVATIEEEQLVQCLMAMNTANGSPANIFTVNPRVSFGFLLTSRSPEYILNEAVTKMDLKEVTTPFYANPGLYTSSGNGGFARIIPAEGGFVTPYPSQQLYTGNKIPEYVWLVLFNKRAVSNGDGGLLVRDREEDFWSHCPEKSKQNLWGRVHQPVIPLMCTANANFRRPYKPRRNTTIRASKPEPDDSRLTTIYGEAYHKMKAAVMKAMAGRSQSDVFYSLKHWRW